VGIIGPVVTLLSSVAAAEAMKLIVGRGVLNPGLLHFDVWLHEYEQFGAGGPRPGCPACDLHHLEFLNAEAGASPTYSIDKKALKHTRFAPLP
jgi:hypothetical protein